MKMTCCECEFPFDYYEGDYDERMCFRCLYEENTEQDKLIQALEGYVKHLRETGKINDLWDNFSQETKEAVRVLITEIGKGRKD
jgi:hypothetical protein